MLKPCHDGDKRGRSFVSIMIVLAVFALLLRGAVQQIIKMNIDQNEQNAFATLKLVGTALENYATDNQGKYPANISVLSQTTPRYLDRNYIEESPIRGYNFSCSRLESSSYSCSAVPVRCSLTGKKAFTIATGGALVSEDCGRKE